MSKTEELGYGASNRFELCLIAHERAKKLISGAKTTLDEKRKPAMIALEEIERNLVSFDELKKIIIEGEKEDDTAVSDEAKKSTNESFSLEEEKEFY
jgi:DNA-directed RNA polymerase omega subunit